MAPRTRRFSRTRSSLPRRSPISVYHASKTLLQSTKGRWYQTHLHVHWVSLPRRRTDRQSLLLDMFRRRSRRMLHSHISATSSYMPPRS